MLDIINLECKYDRVIFSNLNIRNIKPGLNFIIGRSGCGKTSLINSIIGLNKNASGNILLNGKKITNYQLFREKYISIVLQDNKLVPYYTVLENLMMVCTDISKIKKFLSKFHLLSKINKYPDTLSGGEKQRINIIRACLKETYINIFDEPTCSVNDDLKEEIMDMIKTLFKDRIAIIISHNQLIVNKYADRIIDLENNKDIIIKNTEDNMCSEKKYNPPLLKLNFMSYKKRSILPLFIISIVYIIVLCSLSLFSGIDKYVDYNIEKKPDYNYFYLINSKNSELSINDIRYSIENKFEINTIIDYRSLINSKYLDKIRFNDQIIDEYFEIHIYNGEDDILINKQMYELVNNNKMMFIDREHEVKVIDDGKIYTSPSIYFDYNFLYGTFGKIESEDLLFYCDNYKEMYSYLSENYNNIYNLDQNDGSFSFYNSTIMINESLKPLMKSLHSLILILTYSIIVMSITFIKTLIDYNIRLRHDEIDIYNYFGLKRMNLINIYESTILTVVPLIFSIIMFNYLSTLFNKTTKFILNEYYPLFKLDLKLIIMTTIITLIVNILICYGFKFNKSNKKLWKAKSTK